MAISWPDLLVVIAYLAAITIFGALFRKSQPTLREYFLGGRRLPWWAISFAIVTAETSILTIISTPGIAYATNLGFLQLVFGYLVGRVVVSFALIPRYFAGEMFTAYQLIQQRFGSVLEDFYQRAIPYHSRPGRRRARFRHRDCHRGYFQKRRRRLVAHRHRVDPFLYV